MDYRSFFRNRGSGEAKESESKKRDKEVALLEVTALAKKRGLDEVSDFLSKGPVKQVPPLANTFLAGSIEYELRLLAIYAVDGNNLLCSLIAQLIQQQEAATRSARMQRWGLLLLALIALLLWRR